MAEGSERFLKKQRLLKPSEFRIVFKKSTRSVDSRFLVLARANGLEISRLGLVVSKQKLRKAVARNQMKRLVRESFRKNSDALKGLDLVVLPQKNSDDIDRHYLRESLNIHWRRLAQCKNS